MTDGHESASEAEVLVEAAGRMSHSTESLVEQIVGLREDFRVAREQASADIEAAKAKAAKEVAQERRDRKRAGWKFGLVILIDVVLSGVSLGLYVDQRATEAKLHETQTAVLCPLYRLFAQAIQAPRVGETEQQKAVRLAAQKPILDGYTTLGCRPPLSSG